MVDRLVNSEANARRIANVENCFGMSGAQLTIPGRVLVGEGIITKSCRKKLKPRQVFLFNDILVYGSIIINKKKYNRQHIIPLENVKLENLNDYSDLKNGWLIKTPTKSFAVYAATATEKLEWMAHIDKCIEELLTRTGSKTVCGEASQAAATVAPVWVPDNASNICMHCRKTHFSVINRRHHCRNCGDVICGSCSKNKFLLPNQSSKPVRVCNTCNEKLGKSRISYYESSGNKSSVNNNESNEIINNTNTSVKSNIENVESSESDDDYNNKNRQTEDLTKSLEDLTIDEKV